MNVRQLIEKLLVAPPEADVWIEGCDCTASADGVVIGPYVSEKPYSQRKAKENEVIIIRDDRD